MEIAPIDHFALTVTSIERTCNFHRRAVGMQVQQFGSVTTSFTALSFGTQKRNLLQMDRIPDADVMRPTPGSADFCLITTVAMADVVAHLRGLGIPIIEGPIARTGALGAIESIYIRDPDLNLVEIANYLR